MKPTISIKYEQLKNATLQLIKSVERYERAIDAQSIDALGHYKAMMHVAAVKAKSIIGEDK